LGHNRRKNHTEAGRPCPASLLSAVLAAQSLQNMLPQAYRVALTALRKFDHFLRHRVGLGVVVLTYTELAAHVGVRARHDRDGFRFESLILEEAVHGHAGHPRISM
jgi:hypothetical protein